MSDCQCGADADEVCSPDCADIHRRDEDEHWGWAQMLRADRAERELRDAEHKLARVLQMADSWEQTWGDEPVKASAIVHAVRLAIRPQA